MDIGGGRGELSFELLNLNNIRATVVDPRPGCLSKQAKWLKASHSVLWSLHALQHTPGKTACHPEDLCKVLYLMTVGMEGRIPSRQFAGVVQMYPDRFRPDL